MQTAPKKPTPKIDPVEEDAMRRGERLLKLLSWPANGIRKVFFPPYQTNNEILERTKDHEQDKY